MNTIFEIIDMALLQSNSSFLFPQFMHDESLRNNWRKFLDSNYSNKINNGSLISSIKKNNLI